jgi:hypothetical protein
VALGVEEAVVSAGFVEVLVESLFVSVEDEDESFVALAAEDFASARLSVR